MDLANKDVKELGLDVIEIMASGATFCIVIRIQAVDHDRLVNILGYQQKAGAPPAFVRMAIWKMVFDQWSIDVIDIAALIMIIPEAVAWIARYRALILVSFLLFAFAIIGRNANIFSSSPIHIINQ